MRNIVQIEVRSVVVNGKIPKNYFTGFKVRGFLYELLKNVDEDLAFKLHQAKRLAPISVTPLIWESKNTKNVMLRFTFLREDLSRRVINYLMGLSRDFIIDLDIVKIRPLEFLVKTIDPKRIANKATEVQSFAIRFKTPTLLRQSFLRACCPYCPVTKTECPYVKRAKRYRYVPVPDPYLIMRNLLRLWKAFTGVPLKYKEYIQWLLLGGIAIAGIPKLRTVRVYEHKTIPKWSVGFIGEVYFNLPEDTYDSEMARITDALLKFGEYSNVGGNRTAGFGVIEYIPKYSINNESIALKT